MVMKLNQKKQHDHLGTYRNRGRVGEELTLRTFYVAARDLATYLIPGCVGRGVRLGSEGSSVGGGGGGGVWKFGVQKIKKKNKISQNSNPFCPKCRQGLD